MTQKTLTVNGKRFSGKQIAALMNENQVTNGGDYIVNLNGEKFFANFRQRQDDFFAPVCDRSQADSIAMMLDNGTYHYDTWISL